EPEWTTSHCVRCPLVPRAFVYSAGGDPRRLPGYEQGQFVVQELGAQLVAHALGAQPGERILDACAGRGQKATLLAEQVGAGGSVFATDLHPHKLASLDAEAHRLGLLVAHEPWDWTTPPPARWHQAFDRVLI